MPATPAGSLLSSSSLLAVADTFNFLDGARDTVSYPPKLFQWQVVHVIQSISLCDCGVPDNSTHYTSLFVFYLLENKTVGPGSWSSDREAYDDSILCLVRTL